MAGERRVSPAAGSVRERVRVRLETAFARGLLGLPEPMVRLLAGRPIVRDGRTLDPQVQVALRAHALLHGPRPKDRTVAEARAENEVSARQLGPAPRVDLHVEERRLGGRPVRVFRPRSGGTRGAGLVYFHGGGMVIGSVDSHGLVCEALAAEVPCTVVSVDYRLAPEHPFPAAVDDAVAAFRATAAEAGGLGVDVRRLGVGGDSAGATLAAVTCLDTRQDAVRPRLQLLVYPLVDLTMSFPSVEALGRGFFLEADDIRWYRAHYLQGADPRHPRASPWFTDDVRGLPPAIVATAGFDPLRDEGIAWVERLRAAGVPVEHHPNDALFHGFWNTTGVIRSARRAFDDVVRALRAGLAPS